MDGPFRRAERDADAAFLLDLFRKARVDDLAGIDPALRELLLRQQFAGQAMTYRTRHPARRSDVVDCDGAPIGRIVDVRTPDEVRLVDLALLPAWRGRGIGTALIRSLQAEARAACLPLRLSVLASNTDARRFYVRLGFEAVGEEAPGLSMTWVA